MLTQIVSISKVNATGTTSRRVTPPTPTFRVILASPPHTETAELLLAARELLDYERFCVAVLNQTGRIYSEGRLARCSSVWEASVRWRETLDELLTHPSNRTDHVPCTALAPLDAADVALTPSTLSLTPPEEIAPTRSLEQILDHSFLPASIHFLPPSSNRASRRMTLKIAMDAFERQCIEWALSETHGRIVQAAERLGIPRQQLTYRIKRLGIETCRLAARAARISQG